MEKLLVVGNLAKDVINGKEYFGGSAGVIALNSKYLGLDASILSVIGRDHFSKLYLKFLADKNVDVRNVSQVLESMAECHVLNNINQNDSRQWVDNGSSLQMETLDLDREWLQKFDLIHLVSCPPKLINRVVGALQNTLTPISYEPGPRIVLSSDYAETSIIKAAKMVFGNLEEIDLLIKYLKLESPADILNLGPSVVVVTKGRDGSSIYSKLIDGSVEIINILPVLINLVDPTGAGDAYKAAFLTDYLNGQTLRKCGEDGSEFSSRIVSKFGGIYETYDEIVFREV